MTTRDFFTGSNGPSIHGKYRGKNVFSLKKMASPESINSSGWHVRLTIRISVLQWDGRKALCGFFLEPIYRSTAYDCYRIEKRHLNHFVWKRIWEKPGFLEKPGFFLKAWFCGTNLGLSRKPWKFSWSGRSRYIYIIYRDIYFFIYVYNME